MSFASRTETLVPYLRRYARAATGSTQDGDACVQAVPQIEAKLKWPNDVLVDGRKLAGILSESKMGKGLALEWLVLGVGVNVDSYPNDVEWPATSLRENGGKPAKIVELMEAFGRAFTFWYNTNNNSVGPCKNPAV